MEQFTNDESDQGFFLDWVKTRCYVIILYLKKTVLSGKLQFSRKLKRYLGWDGRVSGGISARTEEF